MSLAQMGTAGFEDVRARFAARGQGHVFRFWDGLGRERQAQLLAQAAGLDLDALARHRARGLALATAAQEGLAPAPVERLPGSGGEAAAFARAREAGEALLADGRVAALVLAGGQGTRLGHPGPKGALSLGPVSERSLFGLQAQRLRGLARRHGRTLPWYVMTSAATDAATRACFAREDWYGLDPADVFFFRQAEMPVLDPEGRLVLSAPDHIATAPDGHGGAIPALARSGALRDAEERGVEILFSYQVDNPLVRIGDPVLLGFGALRGAEMASKAVHKRGPDERVGTLVQRDGRLAVVEYTELCEPMRSARDGGGALAFWAGAIGIHALDRRFLARVAAAAEEALPYHLSPKRVPTVDDAGQRRMPTEPNAVKLERFVFDALPWAERSLAVEVRREEEYSPIKNAEGSESPASARRDLVACVRGWLESAGVALPGQGTAIEVDHAVIDGSNDARALRIRRAEEAPHVILTGMGGLG